MRIGALVESFLIFAISMVALYFFYTFRMNPNIVTSAWWARDKGAVLMVVGVLYLVSGFFLLRLSR